AVRLSEALPAVRVGLVHGRMPAAAKDRAMLAFQAGRVQLIIATTVIEVGVDVPNATLMVIDNAERMGLAQLHQLRGPVGRGPEASTCVLLYRAPLSPLARERLRVIRRSSDGFAIAVLSLIFFTWGALTSLNDVLIPHLKAVFEMNYARTMLIQFTFFSTYLVMSLRAGRLSAHVGYKPSMVIGLLIAALGALAFY